MSQPKSIYDLSSYCATAVNLEIGVNVRSDLLIRTISESGSWTQTA